MTPPTAIFILLVSAAAVFAAAQVIRSGTSRLTKAVFVIIRILVAALLILAFTEPVFTVHRIPARDRPLTVLVDASSSMSLFADDTTIERFLDRVRNAGAGRGRSTKVLLFGDSLRENASGATYASFDRKSILPSIGDHPALRDAAGVLIVSDGNWSNSGPVAGEYSEKPVTFLTLTQRRHPAAIVCDAPDTAMTVAGVRSTVSIGASGNATRASTVSVVAATDGGPVFSDTFRVDTGRFSRRIGLRLPAFPPGMHLVSIALTSLPDSVSSMQYILCRAVSSSFTWSIHAGRPSLDERFLRLALAAAPDFKETEARDGSRDQVRFILHAPQAPMPSPSVLPVYIGCLPVAATRPDTVSGAELSMPADAVYNPFDGLELQDMPPSSYIKPERALPPVTVWLSARKATRDTIPLLYSALHRGRPFIACAFEGLWKWDFLPLSHRQGEAEVQMLSRCLLSIIREALSAAATDTMIVWPVGRPSTLAALKLACIAPPHDPASGGGGHRISCSINGKTSAFRFDTTLAVPPTTQLPHYFFLTPPAPGEYSIRCSLSTPIRNYQSIVPFTVDTGGGELPAGGQNTAILRELGLPVDIGDTSRIGTLFDLSDGTPVARPIEERFPIKRSWWILGALFALFGTEWVLRRVWQMESSTIA